ncbi:MAG: hypothetical protein K6F32_05095 [Bacilli bacterium]|nr:hypothetical protein [Bacilli bacterium]
MGSDLLAERARIVDLLSIYGKLLTPKQRDVASAYYLYDLSLSEIAEEHGISRAGVSDALSKAVEHLERYESALELLRKNESLKRELDRIAKLPLNEKLAAFETLGKELENGI